MKKTQDTKKYRVLNPEWLGLPVEAEPIFTETKMGYVLKVGEGEWVGFPRTIIENNPTLFKYIRKKTYGTKFEIVGRNRTSPQVNG